MRSLLVLALALCPLGLHAASQGEAVRSAANPIRKVVTMLQSMQTKVSEEGEKEKELYDKFMCYCKTAGGDLAQSIEVAEAKVPRVEADIKGSEEQKVQVTADLATAQDGRDAAKKTMAEAGAIREKEANTYATTKADYEANVAAIAKAVAALEKGMGSAFLQTGTAKVLQRLALDMSSAVLDEHREELLAFLQGRDTSDYAPQSGQITGILKQMGDEMAKGLADATAAEESAIKMYDDLSAAKTKEVTVLTAKIESHMEKSGELGVSIAQMKEDLTDTQEALMADKEFLNNMEETCSTKTAEWEERQKTRAQELVALADTIKVLNDDDALELFKKTLPSAASSFLQLQRSGSAIRVRALAALQTVRRTSSPDRARLDLIGLALRGKKIGFEKVIGMIDEMVAMLKTEQADDEKKKEYCAAEFDSSDDQKKSLERSISDAETAIEQAEDGIATAKEEAAALTAGIKALDKSVAEATEQRKKEHDEFTELMASDATAAELLGFAKNRLNKFYDPKMYKPPAKRELSTEDRIVVNLGGEAPPTPAPGGIAGTGIGLVEISAHRQRRGEAAPPPPPETFGAYTKKTDESHGVIAMIDLLIKDLNKEMSEAKVDEKNAQEEYEAMMQHSAEKRAADSKSLLEKQKAKADMEAEVESHTAAKTSDGKELMATLKYISSLHAECDWLLQYFDVRKSARSSEIDALGKAKAVLSGADYALVQTGSHGFLRGSP